MKGQTGQTLAEYILAACLVAFVAIGALGMLSDSLRSSLPDLLDRIFGDGPTAGPTGGGGGSGGSASPLNPVTGTLNPPTQIVLNDGTILDLSVNPSQLPTLVETNGANGTTRILASKLEELAKKLKESGELGETQINHLINLANQAHRMAKIEGLVEAAAQDPNFDFMNDRITFEGESLNPYYWAERVGTNPDVDVFNHEHHWGSNSNKAVELHDLMEQYKMAKGSGALNNPEVEALVTDLVGQIGDTAKAFHEASLTMHLGLEGDQTLTDMTASTLTHGHGSTICWTGGGSGSGTRCNNPTVQSMPGAD